MKNMRRTWKIRPLRGFSTRFRCEDIKTHWIRSSRNRKCWQLYIIWKLKYWRKWIENNFPQIKSSYRGNGVFLRRGLRLACRLCVFVRGFRSHPRVFVMFSGLGPVSGNSFQHTSCATKKYDMFPVLFIFRLWWDSRSHSVDCCFQCWKTILHLLIFGWKQNWKHFWYIRLENTRFWRQIHY